MLLSQCFMGNFSSGLLNSKTYANVVNVSVDTLQIWWVRGEEDQRDARLYTTGDFKFEGTHRHDLFHLRLPTNGPFDYKVTHQIIVTDVLLLIRLPTDGLFIYKVTHKRVIVQNITHM